MDALKKLVSEAEANETKAVEALESIGLKPKKMKVISGEDTT